MSDEISPSTLSAVSLASVLDQSVDCVKLVGLQGDVQYMNANGRCAMEIDDFTAVKGRQWAGFWPAPTQAQIAAGYLAAARGEVVRFRSFCPTMKGTPRWWDVTISAVRDAAGEHAGFLAISRDATESQQNREAMDIAQQELRHRLKNTYMMIASLMLGLARGNAQHTEFARQMSERMAGLGRAQALFADNQAPCDLAELIEALVAPFNTEKCTVTIERLPRESVDQGRADAIALVIGELAVNSSKHGAIANGGCITVRGTETSAGLILSWEETSAAPVTATRRDGGQGLTLIERIMGARGGTIRIDWRSDGLDAALSFPAT